MNVETESVLDAKKVIEIGAKHNCIFFELAIRGKLDSPRPALGWVYYPYETERIAIPTEGLRRLSMLRDEGVRASQVIIGHEIPIAEDQSEDANRNKRISPLAVVGLISAVALGAVLIGALAAPAIVTTAVAAPVAIPSASTLGAVGLLTGAALLDPSLVIVCEGTEQWVQIFSWVEA